MLQSIKRIRGNNKEMGLTVDQHRELVVNDIRQALQHVFGEHFEIVDIETTARSAYGPILYS